MADSTCKIDFKCLKALEKLSSGSAGSIFRGEFKGDSVAVKQFYRFNISSEILDRFTAQIKWISELSNANLVKYHGYFEDSEHFLGTVMEFVQGQSLHQFITQEPKFAPRDIFRIACKVAEGLNYLHGNGIIHGSFASAKVLLQDGKDPKIFDFGISQMKLQLMSQRSINSFENPAFLAPECLNQEFNSASDAFAYAVMLWEMLMWEPAYDKANFFTVISATLSGKRLSLPPNDLKLSFLISECWAQDPLERPSFKEIIKGILDAKRETELDNESDQSSWTSMVSPSSDMCNRNEATVHSLDSIYSQTIVIQNGSAKDGSKKHPENRSKISYKWLTVGLVLLILFLSALGVVLYLVFSRKATVLIPSRSILDCTATYPHCSICSDSGACMQCENGHVQLPDGSCDTLNSSRCTLAFGNCTGCLPGYRGCKNCSFNYYNVNGQCQHINSTTCRDLSGGCQSLQGSRCTEHDGNCAVCSPDFQNCVVCRNGFGLIDGICRPLSDYACFARFEHCRTCDEDFQSCNECVSDSFVLIKGRCMAIDSDVCQLIHKNCAKCTGNFKGCETCLEGYVLNNGLCEQITNDVTSLITTTTTTTLSETQTLSSTVSAATITPECLSNCAMCDSFLECLVCNQGFRLTNQRCVRQDSPICHTTHRNCAVCGPDFQTCLQCHQGFQLRNDTCVPSEYGCEENCNKCSSSILCDECRFGYELVDRSCRPMCARNCDECLTPSICTKCKAGYVMRDDGTCDYPDWQCFVLSGIYNRTRGPSQNYIPSRECCQKQNGIICDNNLNIVEMYFVLIFRNWENFKLNGSFPTDFGTFRKLERLYLTNNRFSGEIPPIFSNLTKLRRL
jgi:serine/threonine protein kinase